MKKLGAIAILTHWRTGSTLLRDVLMACGMHDYGDEIGFEHGDINGIGNGLCQGIPNDDAGETVANALKYFEKMAESKEWKHYGIKVDHALQSACWEDVGKQFELAWPAARYVTSIRHPAGIIRSIEKLRKTVKLDPDFTVREILESWLSTYEATKYLVDKKEAQVVVYPDSHRDGSIKKVVGALGLKWTNAASELFDSSTLDDSDEGMEETEDYLKAVEMFEEIKKYAVTPETSEIPEKKERDRPFNRPSTKSKNRWDT